MLENGNSKSGITEQPVSETQIYFLISKRRGKVHLLRKSLGDFSGR